ncbi:MAG: hypothetical protein GY719_38525 [bacterium]|nr:hypothetical protein [bacterium]
MRRFIAVSIPAVGTLAALAVLALAPAPAQAADPQGFIYGKITTGTATYEGRLRWGDEESFWGDHFDSVKEERPHAEMAPRRDKGRREPIKIFGITIGMRWDDASDGRGLIARYGDIREIEVRGDDEAILHMKNGSEVEIDGGSNDVGGKIRVWDREIGQIDVRWDRIEKIELLPTPADLEVAEHRLFGTVETRVGEFTGFIQWDKDECLSTDKLDGESSDGDMEIEMGRIRIIERHSRDSSRVVLVSGRELILDDTNDVDSGNRGIFVEDPRFGRVLVKWDAFERLTLEEPDDSGPAYEDFAPAKALAGKVTGEDGKVHEGRIVYNLDESETWEILGGDRDDIEYHIPFALVSAVIPDGPNGSRVVLVSGEELELEDSSDVAEDNDGVLVLGGGEPVYVAWDRVRRIDFERN